MIPAIGWALLQFVWQGVVIGAAAAFVMWLLRDARPQARLCRRLCRAGVVPGPARARHRGGTGRGARWRRGGLVGCDGAGDDCPASASIPRRWRHGRRASMRNCRWLVALWALGAGALALRMALGLAWVPSHRPQQSGHRRRLLAGAADAAGRAHGRGATCQPARCHLENGVRFTCWQVNLTPFRVPIETSEPDPVVDRSGLLVVILTHLSI